MCTLSTEFHAHDGTAWRKAKGVFIHDSTGFYNPHQAYVHDGTAWRLAYTRYSKKFTYTSPAIYQGGVDSIIILSGLDVYKYVYGDATPTLLFTAGSSISQVKEDGNTIIFRSSTTAYIIDRKALTYTSFSISSGVGTYIYKDGILCIHSYTTTFVTPYYQTAHYINGSLFVTLVDGPTYTYDKDRISFDGSRAYVMAFDGTNWRFGYFVSGSFTSLLTFSTIGSEMVISKNKMVYFHGDGVFYMFNTAAGTYVTTTAYGFYIQVPMIHTMSNNVMVVAEYVPSQSTYQHVFIDDSAGTFNVLLTGHKNTPRYKYAQDSGYNVSYSFIDVFSIWPRQFIQFTGKFDGTSSSITSISVPQYKVLCGAKDSKAILDDYSVFTEIKLCDSSGNFTPISKTGLMYGRRDFFDIAPTGTGKYIFTDGTYVYQYES